MSEVAGARAIVHFAFIVRNGVAELCLCVRFILIDKSLSIHVPLELELLVARVQQDRIGGGFTIFQICKLAVSAGEKKPLFYVFSDIVFGPYAEKLSI